jgi:putative transposase
VEQIVAVLKQAELGVPVADLIRQVGITEQTLYRWKKQYKGLETDQVRFRQLQRERTAKAAGQGTEPGQDDVARLAGKKTVTPSRCRPVVSYLYDTYRVSERRACRVGTRIPVSTFRGNRFG